MMKTESYTPECLQALQWFAEREPVGWFDKTAPNHSMRSSLERRGLIERLPRRGFVQLIRYRLTPRGHAAMKATQR